jgi:predicted ATP-dependent endonuclease of OLD family
MQERINKLVADEILPTMIDSYGDSGLSIKIKDLKKKITEVDILTQEILKEKNKLISENFQNIIKQFPEIQAGISLEEYALEVSLSDDSLSEILSKRIVLNVKDASHNEVDSKGSGIQKLVLMTLLDYFSKNVEEKARYTNPFLIWAIDEPETYLQPKLQKKIGNMFEKVSKTHQVICTTHSPKMINIYNPKNVKLFYLDSGSMKVKRKNNKTFSKKNTKYLTHNDTKFVDTLKDHFGVEANDGWIIRDKNVIFEGNDDVNYFHSTFKLIMGYSLDVANIIANSSENVPNFIELLKQQIAQGKLEVNAIICLLDNDESGRRAYEKINSDKKRFVKKMKTISLYLTKEENENTNFPSMIEDMIIPEIFFECILDFLKGKYEDKDFSKYSFDAFYTLRQQTKRTPIMEVVDNFFTDIISNEKNFSFKHLDIKYGLSIQYQRKIEQLSSDKTQEYKNKYKKLEDFFKGFE